MLCKKLIGSLVFLLATIPLTTFAAENVPSKANWPQFRGPNRDGVSTDTGLLKKWDKEGPKDGPKLLWEVKGAGRGYSSLAIADGKVYTMGDDQKDEYLICLDEATGKQQWKTKLGTAWEGVKPEIWQSSRSTPTVDGELLYVVTPHGDLVCLESAGGKERWRKNMLKDLGGKKKDGWGYSESVLIDGDRVICTPGGEKATLAALDKKTGAKIWTTTGPKTEPNDRGAAHASIVVAEVGKTRVYVQTTHAHTIGVGASDGQLLWAYPFRKISGAHISAVVPTPIIRGDLVFLSVGYGCGGALLRQTATPDGGVKMQEVYGLKTELNNKHGGVVLVGDFLYGDRDDKGTPWCAELMTGKVRWTGRGSGSKSAAVTAADGHLYIRYASGHMVLVKASPDQYKEISSFKVPHSGGRPSWSHPVVTGGKLFLREGDWVLCYDLRGK